jgi:type IV pilus assembly protein PilQ
MDNQLIINLKTPPLAETKADLPQPPSVAPVEVAKEEPQKPAEPSQPPSEAPVEVTKEEPQKPVEAPQPPAETPPVAPVEVAKEEPQKPVEVPQPPAETPPVAPVEVAKEEDPKKLKEPPKPPSVAPVEVAKEEPQKPVEVPKEIEKESPSVTAKEEQKEKATAVTGVKVDNQLIVNLKTPPSPELPKEKDKKEKKEIIAKKAEDSSEMVEKKVSPSEKEKILKKEITSQDTTLSTQKVDEPVPSIKKDTPLTEKTQTPKSPEVPVSGKYTGKKVSFDFRDIDIISLLYLFESVSGMNFIVSPEVRKIPETERKVTLKMREVPWDQALDIILRTHHLGKVVEDNIVMVAPHAVAMKVEKERQQTSLELEQLKPKPYRLIYASAENVKSQLLGMKQTLMEDKVTKEQKITYEYDEKQRILSHRGSATADRDANVVVVTDTPNKIAEVDNFIMEIDKPVLQVSIEAKIVEASTNFTRELGIQWGFKNVQSAAYGNPLPYTFPHSMTVGGSTLTGGTGMSGNSWAVNLPATVGAGAGGALGVTLGNITNSFTLDLQISALEDTGKGKILSNPRITTLDNKQATIRQGEKIPYATTSAEGTKTEFVDAVLELKVTPTIRYGGISMRIEIKKDEADFSKMSGGVPTINTKVADTSVLVKDGETIVIGGIMKTTQSDSIAGIPLLHKIPILGWLFKKETAKEDTTELLIFITPRIVKPY